jgi:CheY-like chemotaxis protein
MRGISGLELAGRIHQEIPGLPVLLTTGYSEVLGRDRLEEAGVETVLMKPFGRHSLGWAVANLLGEGP